MKDSEKKELAKELNEYFHNSRLSKGKNREILEVENIRANTALSFKTLAKLKNDFWYNIIYIVLGFLLGFVPQLMNENKMIMAIELMSKSITEKDALEKQNQIEFQQMRLEIISLKKEVDSLNIK